MSARPCALHVSPHPDDETLGGGPALGVLHAAGWRIVNLACGLGRPEQHERRGRELAAALAEWGFEDERIDPPVPIGGRDDLVAARTRIAAEVTGMLARLRPAVVVSPHEDDAHHGHETVARAVMTALGRGSGADPAVRWWAWGLWRDLAAPNVLVPVTAEVVDRAERSLAHHAGELRRAPYGGLPAARGRVAAALGWERVFGFGSASALSTPYADLLLERVWSGVDWVAPAGYVLSGRQMDRLGRGDDAPA